MAWDEPEPVSNPVTGSLGSSQQVTRLSGVGAAVVGSIFVIGSVLGTLGFIVAMLTVIFGGGG